MLGRAEDPAESSTK